MTENTDIHNKERELYLKVLHHLETEKVWLDSSLSLKKFSSIVGTNTSYLSNMVNRHFGCNYKRLLNRYRIRYAVLLLDNGVKPEMELFRRCGFASKSVFYAAFSDQMGITPTRYAKGLTDSREAKYS